MRSIAAASADCAAAFILRGARSQAFFSRHASLRGRRRFSAEDAAAPRPLPPPPPGDSEDSACARADALAGLPPGVASAARALTQRLADVGAPCAVIGAVACNAYGHRRATQDVDVLVNARDADAVRAALVGRGWAPRFPGARKMLRDKVHAVDVDVLHSGSFPGDGLPKPVAFPELSPRSDDVSIIDGVRFITLPKLIELKLASGTSAPSRAKDLADVYALVAANALPRGYAVELDVSVRAAYCKIWDEWHASRVSGLDP
jgi:hypothetical protein